MQIRTQRLLLRTPAPADAARLSTLAGDYDIACMTGTIPHPYSEQAAAEWLAGALAGDEGVVLVIEREGALIGCTGYRAYDADHAELGYWIGKPYWGHGFATEAVRAVIAHAFDTDSFIYLKAGHFVDNPASARILDKVGFVVQGNEMRDCVARNEVLHCLTYRLGRAEAEAFLRSS